MKILTAAVVVAAAVVATLVQAEVQRSSGKIDKMVTLCLQEQDELALAACQGFVLGVVATSGQYAAMGRMSPAFCTSRDIDSSELVAVYRQFLEQSRASHYFPAAILAITAFGERYPCQQEAAP